MAHPEDQGRCLLDGYFECPAIVPEACICVRMPPTMAIEMGEKKYGKLAHDGRRIQSNAPVTNGEGKEGAAE